MGRRINTEFAVVDGTLGSGNVSNRPLQRPKNAAGTIDDYTGRLLKYIPAEIVALYLAARGIVPSDKPDSDTILWAVIVITWLLVPVYLIFATREASKGPLWWQVTLGTIAFPVWVCAIGNKPLADLSWYAGHQFVGSILLMFVTVLFGLKKP